MANQSSLNRSKYKSLDSRCRESINQTMTEHIFLILNLFNTISLSHNSFLFKSRLLPVVLQNISSNVENLFEKQYLYCFGAICIPAYLPHCHNKTDTKKKQSFAEFSRDIKQRRFFSRMLRFCNVLFACNTSINRRQ